MDEQASVNPIKDVVRMLRQDRKIEAIKVFRDAFEITSLKVAKDAVEAIAECLSVVPGHNEYIVISRYELGDDYQVIQAYSKEEAMQEANDIVGARIEVAVANVVAKSVITRSMAEVT